MSRAAFGRGRKTVCLRETTVTLFDDGRRIDWRYPAQKVLSHPDGTFAFGTSGGAFLADDARSPRIVGSLKFGEFRSDHTIGIAIANGSIVCAGQWVQWWNPRTEAVINVAKLTSSAASIVDDGDGGFAVVTRGGSVLWWPYPFSSEPRMVLEERIRWYDDILPSMRELEAKVRTSGVRGAMLLDSYGLFALVSDRHACIVSATKSMMCVERIVEKDEHRVVCVGPTMVAMRGTAEDHDELFVLSAPNVHAKFPDPDGRVSDFEKEHILTRTLGACATCEDTTTLKKICQSVPLVINELAADFNAEKTVAMNQISQIIQNHRRQTPKFPLRIIPLKIPDLAMACKSEMSRGIFIKMAADIDVVAQTIMNDSAGVNIMDPILQIVARIGVFNTSCAAEIMFGDKDKDRMWHVHNMLMSELRWSIDGVPTADDVKKLDVPSLKLTFGDIRQKIIMMRKKIDDDWAHQNSPVRIRSICGDVVCTSHGAFRGNEWISRKPCVHAVSSDTSYVFFTHTGEAYALQAGEIIPTRINE